MRNRRGISPTWARWNIPGSSLRLARSPVAPKRTITWFSGIWEAGFSVVAVSVSAHASRLTDGRRCRGRGRGLCWRGPMAPRETKGGVEYDPQDLDRVERRFWRDIWESVPAEIARERGVAVRDFGPIQATAVSALAGVGMMNLVLGAAEPGAVEDGHLAAAIGWVRELGVDCYVSLTPGLAGAEAAANWLAANGFARTYAWMKFVRDAHPPRFSVSSRCRGRRGHPHRSGALRDDRRDRLRPPGLERGVLRRPPRQRGLALLRRPGRRRAAGLRRHAHPPGDRRVRHRRHARARPRTRLPARPASAPHRRRGGRRLPHPLRRDRRASPERPSVSYRNILRAGFEEAYLRPNWRWDR